MHKPLFIVNFTGNYIPGEDFDVNTEAEREVDYVDEDSDLWSRGTFHEVLTRMFHSVTVNEDGCYKIPKGRISAYIETVIREIREHTQTVTAPGYCAWKQKLKYEILENGFMFICDCQFQYEQDFAPGLLQTLQDRNKESATVPLVAVYDVHL